jgi:hypothetical protein
MASRSSCEDVTDQLNFTQYWEYDPVFFAMMPHTNVSLRLSNREELRLSRSGQAMIRGYVGLVSAELPTINLA